ncbi:hypothetical protein [Aestuariibacter sp. A3R04]|uniref:hypothetical protein n=1 Tax=Aestuariibacter sp. A3R04 TaxID=2841571 RepID=UPI001C09D1AA|nr:hypothetical protein [Aestuariibacter sp. A3R04]MBU3021204.1 hypothetical protein [Aestuariibacter sp. A3R04]
MQTPEQEYLIDNNVQLFLVAPVWFSSASVGMSPQERPTLLELLQEELNEDGDCGVWKLEKFLAPRTLMLRKYGQLWREFSFNSQFMQAISSIFGEDLSDAVFARLTIFDYGLGNVEVSVNLPLANTESLEDVATKAEALKLKFVKEFNQGLPNAELELTAIDKKYVTFSEDYLNGVVNQLRPEYDEGVVPKRVAFMCGPVSRNLLFVNSGGVCPQLTVHAQQLHETAYTFLNDANDNMGFTGSEKIPISHEGFEGAVALVNRSESSCIRYRKNIKRGMTFSELCAAEKENIKRTKFLWSLVHLYWSALFCSSEGYYVIAASSRIADYKSMAAIHEEIRNIENYQSIISMIKFESQPEKVIVEGEDSIRYAAIWDAYKSEDLIRSLIQIQSDSEQSLLTLRDKMRELSNKRTNRILAAFTGFTIISVIIDLILFYDVQNLLPPPSRFSYLGYALSALGILTLGYWGVNFILHRAAILRKE